MEAPKFRIELSDAVKDIQPPLTGKPMAMIKDDYSKRDFELKRECYSTMGETIKTDILDPLANISAMMLEEDIKSSKTLDLSCTDYSGILKLMIQGAHVEIRGFETFGGGIGHAPQTAIMDDIIIKGPDK